MGESSKSLFVSAETICKECNTHMGIMFFGRLCITRVNIYHMILSSMFNSENFVSSNYVADFLQQDHEDVMQAMRELHRINHSVFELEEGTSYQPPIMTEAGRSLLEQPLISLVENGLFHDIFLDHYPREIINLATINQWIQTEIRENDSELVVSPGPNRAVCENICKLLQRVQFSLHVTTYEKHLLLKAGVVSTGPVSHIIILKQGIDFPTDLDGMSRIWFKMANFYLKSLIEG